MEKCSLKTKMKTLRKFNSTARSDVGQPNLRFPAVLELCSEEKGNGTGEIGQRCQKRKHHSLEDGISVFLESDLCGL